MSHHHEQKLVEMSLYLELDDIDITKKKNEI